MAYAALDYDGNGSIGPDDFDLVARRQVLLDILIAKVSVWPISGVVTGMASANTLSPFFSFVY